MDPMKIPPVIPSLMRTLRVYRYHKIRRGWKHLSKPDSERDSPSSIMIVTWNIEFSSPHVKERCQAALRHLRDAVVESKDGRSPDPCIIQLQEVHTLARQSIMDDDWVRENFVVTDGTKWPIPEYGNMTLITKSLVVMGCKQLEYANSGMGRTAIIVDLKLCTPSGEGVVIRFINTHLESLPQGEMDRPFQLNLCAQLLSKPAVHGGIVAGDMNAISENDELLPQSNGLRDAWWKKDGTGYTWGYQGNSQNLPKGRLDKILYLPNRGFRVSEPEKIGVGCKTERAEWVSDHYGLCCMLHVM